MKMHLLFIFIENDFRVKNSLIGINNKILKYGSYLYIDKYLCSLIIAIFNIKSH